MLQEQEVTLKGTVVTCGVDVCALIGDKLFIKDGAVLAVIPQEAALAKAIEPPEMDEGTVLQALRYCGSPASTRAIYTIMGLGELNDRTRPQRDVVSRLLRKLETEGRVRGTSLSGRDSKTVWEVVE